MALSGEFDALILMGNPNYLSTWIAAAAARLRGTPVLFWTHGWLRPERRTKAMIRRLFYRLADRLLLYGERARALGLAQGFAPERLTVIYNSLDVARADAIIARIDRVDRLFAPPQQMFAAPERPLVICTARMTPLCRFDLLIEAAARLAAQGRPINILLVGDGPSREPLERLSARLGIDVHFAGAVYDEDRLGEWLHAADLTVSPGKIGLTAIHSLMYGTPAITHANLDDQMPEVEAIVPGETGALFRQGDIDDLATTIDQWLSADRETVRAACRLMVHGKWNPAAQANAIAAAIASTMHRSL
jgi:glycosyltransferase involved in cell wall biosynthesis